MSNIIGFVKSLLPFFNKSDIESDLNTSLESIATVKTTWKNLEELLTVHGVKGKTVKEYIKTFYKELKSTKLKQKLSSNNNIGMDIQTLMANVEMNGDVVRRAMEESMNDVVVSSAMTAWNANILRGGGHIYFITRYALDLANYFYIKEMEETGVQLSDDYKLNKKQIEFIEKNAWIFVRLLGIYGDVTKEFRSKIEKLNDVTLNKDTGGVIDGGFDGDNIDIASNLPNGFIGSPLYSINMVFAQWEADRYKTIKDRKRLMELRYLHLKMMREQGNSDIALEKEITYIQKELTNMDYKLSKIEASLE